MPVDIQRLLESSRYLRDVVIDCVLPEHKIRFDGIPGEPRNADLAIAAHDPAGKVAITIEGKADAAFDQPVESVLRRAVDRIASDQRTGAIRRIEGLASVLLSPWHKGLTHLGALRYQLLTAVAGTVAWAQALGADRAVLIVHEFVTPRTRDENHERNATDLNAFVARISNGRIGNVP